MKEIREFEGLRALRLEGNTVGVEAAQAIAKALEDKRDFQVYTMSTHLLICLTMSQTETQSDCVSHSVLHLLTWSHNGSYRLIVVLHRLVESRRVIVVSRRLKLSHIFL